MSIDVTKCNNDSERPWHREPMVWMVIMIPLTSVIVGMAMLTMSIRSYDGLVVDDYYKRGKEINRVLERTQRAIDQNISATLTFSAQGQIIASLKHNGAFSAPDELNFSLLHRTRTGFDRSVSLLRYADGHYRADFETPHKGHWLARIETKQWWIGGSLSLPSKQQFTLKAQP